MNYHVWGAMLKAYHKLKAKPKTITELEKSIRFSGATCHKDRSAKL